MELAEPFRLQLRPRARKLRGELWREHQTTLLPVVSTNARSRTIDRSKLNSTTGRAKLSSADGRPAHNSLGVVLTAAPLGRRQEPGGDPRRGCEAGDHRGPRR